MFIEENNEFKFHNIVHLHLTQLQLLYRGYYILCTLTVTKRVTHKYYKSPFISNIINQNRS